MSVNKIKIVLPADDQYVNIPIEMKWDFTGREDSVLEYQTDMVQQVLGGPNDFEIARFEHKPYKIGKTDKTSLNYQFYFYSGNNDLVSAATVSNWVTSYLAEGFTPNEVYYYTKPFTKSFFKLDFYDTPDDKTQKNYFTIILPVQQGFTESVSISPVLPNVDIRIPKFRLDYIGDKEGFFIYWLRDTDYIDQKEFYMSAKFFDGRTGVYVKMMNTPQPLLPLDFTFNGNLYFYYKVNLDYGDKTFEIYRHPNFFGNRSGTEGTPIKWYEYVNPE